MPMSLFLIAMCAAAAGQPLVACILSLIAINITVRRKLN